jgi:hypothetical protein
MTEKDRCGRITAPKRHAAEGPGGKGMVRNHSIDRDTMGILQTNNHPLEVYGAQMIVN